MEKKKILKYAYESTDFYQKKLRGIDADSDWEEVPITLKSEIAHAGISCISLKYYAKLGSSEIVSDYTSGSTGECLEVLSTKKEQAKSLLSLWLWRKKFYGVDSTSRFCFFYTFRDCRGDVPVEHRKNALGFSKGILKEEKLDYIYMRQ